MDKLSFLRHCVKQLLNHYAAYRPAQDGVEVQTIYDTEHDHYQLVTVGWLNKDKHLHGCSIHLDIKNEKIWIQHNGTEDDIAVALVDMGVDKQDIVIGFHPPIMRQMTEYALG